ncbi:MAG TPA: c-type cytochrome domain-containing protein [Kofleriaceae bacterium]|jgi:hypothetical protein|nr:c-type cytochrome domain-containing protein [Kofleriaceae bacterium]
MLRFLRTAAVAGLAVGLAGCPDDELTCVDIDPACTPLYEPTWANVFDNTLAPKCGVGGSSCHGGASPWGALHLDDPTRAHADLTRAGAGIVIAGEPSCSEMIMRLNASSSKLVMPRGSRLQDSEICALERWVAAGAPGPAPAAGGDATVSAP